MIMKKLTYLSIVAVALILASCAKDSKDDPAAPSPTTDPRDQYVAYWNVSENSATVGVTTHTVNIVKSTTNSSEVLLNNFSGLSVSARATVNNNHLTIPYQQLGSIGFAQGSGTLTTASKIDMTYTTTISGNRDSSIAVYTK
jgi:PBP1b-binding outer membrane lipoprotein LpoB